MQARNDVVSVRNPWIWRFFLVACLVFFWLGIQQPLRRGRDFTAALVCGIIAVRMARRKG